MPTLRAAVVRYARSRWPTLRRIARRVRPVGWVAVVLSIAIGTLGYYRNEFPNQPQPIYLGDMLGLLPWYFWALGALVVVLLIGFEAAHREIQSILVPPLEHHIPANRDALVAAITAYEKNANDVISDRHVMAMLRAEHPDRANEFAPNYELYKTFEESGHALLVQERIAGQNFEIRLSLYRTRVHFELYRCDDQNEPAPTEEDYAAVRSKIHDSTREVLRLLDSGTLYVQFAAS